MTPVATFVTNFMISTIPSAPFLVQSITRLPLVLYRSPECVGYAELEQAWKYMTMHFAIQNQKGPNLTLLQNRSRSIQGNHLNNFGST